MNDKFYAFDADKPGPPLWMRDFTDELAGVIPVPVTDITGRPDLNVVGNVGVEGTPVIDAASRAIFVVVRTRENGVCLQRLHKLGGFVGAGLSLTMPPSCCRSSCQDASQRRGLAPEHR
jgi:hypothetical protein